MAAMIKLIVGLGNPGDQYADTRHNAGFWLLDELCKEFSFDSYVNSFVGQINIGQHSVFLMKPQTYMNLSGEAVAKFCKINNILPTEVLIIHDELDLPPGIARIKTCGSAGGHNGLKSITSLIGTDVYYRMRIGVGHPRTLRYKQSVVDFVLNRPSKSEQELINKSIDSCIEILPLLVDGSISSAMLKLHSDK